MIPLEFQNKINFCFLRFYDYSDRENVNQWKEKQKIVQAT